MWPCAGRQSQCLRRGPPRVATLYSRPKMGSKLHSASARRPLPGSTPRSRFGFLGTIVAARVLGVDDFGLFATVIVATGFFQTLLDLTVEEALVKYGFRYATAEEWGRLRRLFARALRFKLAGGAARGLALARARAVRGLSSSTRRPRLAASARGRVLPLVQAPEDVAGAALILRGRYDVRGGLPRSSMALRLAGVAIGAQLRRARGDRRRSWSRRRSRRRRHRRRRRGVPPLPRRAVASRSATTAARSCARSSSSRALATGLRLAAHGARAAAARRRRGARAGRPLPHRAGAAGRLRGAQLARPADPAHRADARLGARRDRRASSRRPALQLGARRC